LGFGNWDFGFGSGPGRAFEVRMHREDGRKGVKADSTAEARRWNEEAGLPAKSSKLASKGF
jgi:hypothetical protein